LLAALPTGSSTALTAAFLAFLTVDSFADRWESFVLLAGALLTDDFSADALLAGDLVTVAVA